MLTENREIAEQKRLKAFCVSGHVEIEINATVYAKSVKDVEKWISEYEKKYGKGNGTMLNYEEGNWCGPVIIDNIEPES